MSIKPKLSVWQKLLISALHAQTAIRNPFTAEDLVVSAWKSYPDTFGLAGYNDDAGNPRFPDSNRVFAEIMGSKPIRKMGFLKKVGTKMYQLTEVGRDRAESLLTRNDEPEIRKASFSREMETELSRILMSKAAEKYRDERQTDITFNDACALWGISPRSSAIEMTGRLSHFDVLISRVTDAIGDGQVSFDHGGTAFGIDEIRRLENMSTFLQLKFREELETIRRRTDERR